MKFCCASNAAIKKMSKSREKKSTFLPQYFQQNRHFLKKNTDI